MTSSAVKVPVPAHPDMSSTLPWVQGERRAEKMSVISFIAINSGAFSLKMAKLTRSRAGVNGSHMLAEAEKENQ